MNCPKCQIPIADHPANAHLNALFCTEVMKWIGYPHPYDAKVREWRKPPGKHEDFLILADNFCPSTNIAHAMQGVEKHREDIALQIRIDLSEVWCDLGERKYDVYELHTYTKGISQPINNLISLAITRAFVLWAMEGKGK